MSIGDDPLDLDGLRQSVIQRDGNELKRKINYDQHREDPSFLKKQHDEQNSKKRKVSCVKSSNSNRGAVKAIIVGIGRIGIGAPVLG